MEQPPGTDVNIFHYGSSTARLPTANLHLLLTPSGSLAFGNGYGFGTIQGGPPLIDGRWHFAAGVYHGDAKARIFLDGSEVKAGTLKQRPDTGAASNWTIGLFMGGGQPLKGVIDDVRVYGEALRSTEIFALHRCISRAPDLSLGRLGNGYLLPIFDFVPDVEANEIRFGGMDHFDERPYGGFQFALPSQHCGIESLRGARLPISYDLSMEIQVESGGSGHKSGAGPLLGMEPLAPGSPVEASRHGYSIRLESDGTIAAYRPSHPRKPIASAKLGPAFDGSRYHRLGTRIRSGSVELFLDGNPVNLGIRLEKIPEDSAAGVGFFVDGKPLRGREPRARALAIIPR